MEIAAGRCILHRMPSTSVEVTLWRTMLELLLLTGYNFFSFECALKIVNFYALTLFSH